MQIYLTTNHPECQAKTRDLSDTLGISLHSYDSGFQENEDTFLLIVTPDGLLLQQANTNMQPLQIDFTSKRSQQRLESTSRHSLFGKAIGITPKETLRVLDTTAGCGQDALVLAHLGCEVTMLERSPIIAAMLHDALEHARFSHPNHPTFERLHLYKSDAHDFLCDIKENTFDIVYIDPMFPEKSKHALPQKNMQLFQALIGKDADADTLLPLARRVAKKRVVVKRHKKAPYLNGETPDHSYKGKSTRFDVYFTHC